ncbi:MAG TPA: PAS domain-containing protein [Flavitalea sp.]|nr:PAS domain-containing protein [Flavitalea sp.]
MKLRLSSSFILALVFLLFGTIWTLLSDAVLMSFTRGDIELNNKIQNLKGVIFVIASAIFIYLVSTSLNRRILKANKKKDEALMRFNMLGMATNDAVWDIDLITRESYTNRTLQDIFGYSPEELSDNYTWWRTNLHPEDEVRVLETIDNILENGGSFWKDEYRFKCKNGKYKVIFDRGVIIRDQRKKPVRIIGAMQDITTQRALQDELISEKLVHKNEMAKGILHAAEAERKKLGEELHDNINQLLGVVRLYIEHAITNRVEQDTLLRKSSLHLKTVIEEIRALSRSLIPPTLNDLGLVESIHELAESIAVAKNIKFSIEYETFNESGLTSSKQLMLYRILQEQLNNIIKHSEADLVKIELIQLPHSVQLIITDNGIGFDVSNNKIGMGLTNIRNRLEIFNGKMKLTSSPGNGCKLAVEFEE